MVLMAGAVLVLPAALYAQPKPAAVPARADQQFEVATIKPVDQTRLIIMGIKVYPGGRVVASALPLKSLIAAAFDIPYGQISGGERWTDDEMYVVEAKPDVDGASKVKTLRYANYSLEDEYLRKLLQALLIDRFQLKYHWASTTGRIFELKRSGDTLRMSPQANIDELGEDKNALFGSIGFAAARWVLANTSMPQLATFASRSIVHAPVVDRTGLTGYFNYWQPPESEPYPNYSDNSASFMNLLKEVGLKLERTEGNIETFVIDAASRPGQN